mgnify:CR=1 FL=1
MGYLRKMYGKVYDLLESISPGTCMLATGIVVSVFSESEVQKYTGVALALSGLGLSMSERRIKNKIRDLEERLKDE